jgi:hypothetical protein
MNHFVELPLSTDSVEKLLSEHFRDRLIRATRRGRNDDLVGMLPITTSRRGFSTVSTQPSHSLAKW